MKTFSKQIVDQSESDFQQIRRQLQECQSQGYSSRQVVSSSKFKSFSSKASVSKPKQSQDAMQSNNAITNTEQAFNIKLNALQGGYQSANSLMIGKSPNNDVTAFFKNSKRANLRPRKIISKKPGQLKDVIKNQKINDIKKTFCSKIKRNNQYSEPINYQIKDKQRNNVWNSRGIEFGEIKDKVYSIISIANILSSIIIYTLSLAFPQIRQNVSFITIEILNAVFFLIEIIVNFITIRVSFGKRLQTIEDIGSNYLKNRFAIDGINLLILLVYLSTDNFNIGFFRITSFFKLQDCLQKIQKLQVYFIENYYNQQYWSLVKVFLFNFCFAHMLAILLVSMSNANSSQNWLITKNLINSPWYQKYIWSYYWGTTIMLTIGFGDIIPACYQQALCMIFIQTVSCIVLAYNINCVGSLIANIRSQDIQKSKSMKIFKKLADKHNIQESLVWKINNYIEENSNIKKLFNIQEEAQFVSKLPNAFKADYLKQANKSIFQNLFFFNNLMEKTLFSLALKIEMKIAHPEELIAFNIERNFDVFILKNGQVGFISRKIHRNYNKNIFDTKKVEGNASLFLLNTNFITKNRSNYGIKSLVYSVLYYLEYDSLIEILKESNMDYELYCRYRDKNKNKIDQFQVFPCQFCTNQNHTKFDCPRLHFIPIQQHVINKYLYKQKKDRNSRNKDILIIQNHRESSLINYLYNIQVYNLKKQQQANSSIAKKVKQQKFIINQFKTFQRQTQQLDFKSQKNSSLEAITKIQSKFLENTTQMIKAQISKAMGQQRGEDITWILDLDRMKNYKGYFAQNNPCNLTDTFKLQERLTKLAKINVFQALAKIVSKQTTQLRFQNLYLREKDTKQKIKGIVRKN